MSAIAISSRSFIVFQPSRNRAAFWAARASSQAFGIAKMTNSPVEQIDREG
jgi:hypothetical protein